MVFVSQRDRVGAGFGARLLAGRSRAKIIKRRTAPHAAMRRSYEATAQDQLTLSNADLVIENGGGYDPFIDSMLEASGDENVVVVNASEASGLLEDGEEGDDDHAGETEEEHAAHIEGFNVHVWYSFHGVERNEQGLAGLKVDAMLVRVGPRRARAAVLHRRGNRPDPRCDRDHVAAREEGLRDGPVGAVDWASLRLDEIDWHRDENRLVQHKTSAPLTLPLSAEAGNAVADWLMEVRPVCDASEVFVRLYAPFTKLTGPTGALVMRRWLTEARVSHEAHDGKTFHALRRTTGTRLVESGAELAATSRIRITGSLAIVSRVCA